LGGLAQIRAAFVCSTTIFMWTHRGMRSQ
jgi:hypothetical protein